MDVPGQKDLLQQAPEVMFSLVAKQLLIHASRFTPVQTCTVSVSEHCVELRRCGVGILLCRRLVPNCTKFIEPSVVFGEVCV